MIGDFKLVRCGCGGKAVAIGDDDNNIYFVKCDKCWISTNLFHSKAEAIMAWNKAMSGAKDINVHNKFAADTNVGDKERTAKVTKYYFIYGFDGQCECGKRVDAHWNYCPSCGARLEWE